MTPCSKRLLLVALLAALAAPAAARPGSYGSAYEAPPSAPRFAEFSSIEGLPRDSASRAIVTDAMRLAFGEGALPVEGPGAPAAPLVHRFRLLEGLSADTVWSVQVVLGLPPEQPRRASDAASTRDASRPAGILRATRKKGGRITNGLIVAVAALSPEARFQGARPIPIRSEILLPADTSGVYPWAEAGRAAGRLAIEGLLRAAGDLTPEQRLALAPAVRSGPNAR